MLALHCGAGRHSTDSLREEEYLLLCRRACHEGIKLLRAGESGTEVIVAVIRMLEDSPLTNAGKGSALNLDGHVECDASLMISLAPGTTKSSSCSTTFAGVGAVVGVKNPIEAASSVLRHHQQHPLMPLGRIPPFLLVGEGATLWAKKAGLATSEDPQLLVTESARRRHTEYLSRVHHLTQQGNNPDGVSLLHKSLLKGEARTGTWSGDSLGAEVFDTVGAVCYDLAGNLAAGVSSGGIPLKFPGRVGEAAVCGAGCWAFQSNPLLPPSAPRTLSTAASDSSPQVVPVGVACSASGILALFRMLLI